MCRTSCFTACVKGNDKRRYRQDSAYDKCIVEKSAETEPMTEKSSDLELAKTLVQTLLAKGIRLLALDFDKTIVSVHTAGYWRQGTPKLVEHVRPCFKDLIQAALEIGSGLHLAVVTYSMQPGLIRDVLHYALPNSDTGRIFIRANTSDWAQQCRGTVSLGKQQHIACITTELFNQKHAIIHPKEIFLMDDDIENVNVAIQFGHKAFEVKDDITLNDVRDFIMNEL